MIAQVAIAQETEKMLQLQPEHFEIFVTPVAPDSFDVTLHIPVLNRYQWPEEAIVRADIYCGDQFIGRRLANNYLPENSTTTVRFTLPVTAPDTLHTSNFTLPVRAPATLYTSHFTLPVRVYVSICSLIGEPYDQAQFQ